MQHNKDAHETVVKRVSRKHDDHGHGGAWKVAFADFCLALLCLFLVMWLLAARNTERIEEAVRSAGASSLLEGAGAAQLGQSPQGSLIERHPVPSQAERRSQEAGADARVLGMAARRYDSAADLQGLAALIEKIGAEEGLGANVHTVVTPQGLRLMLHDTDSRGMFERGSALPSDRFKSLLRKLGPLLAKVQNQLLIVGHTDASQYSERGPAAYSNWALSSQRAMAARLHLLEGGMPESSVLQVSGMADSAPLDAKNPLAAVNRRIELIVLSSQQSSQMAEMFGAPRRSVPVGEGLSAETPAAAQSLRRTLQADGAH